MTTQSDPLTHSDKQEISRLVSAASQENRGDVYAGKRRWPRYTTGMQLEATFDRSNPPEVFPVTMHNVSDIGLAFWTRAQIEPSTDIYLREFTNHDDCNWVGAHVTHCTPGIRGFLIGAQFHNPLTPEDSEPGEEELVAVGQDSQASDCQDDPAPKRRGLLDWLGWGRKGDDA